MRYKVAAWVLGLSPILVPFVIVPLAERAIVTIIGDKLDRASKRLAGPNATNCGQVPFGADARKATMCALGAFRDKKPFRVRYSLQDITFVDATKDVSVVGAPDGHVYELSSYYGFQSPASGEDVTAEQCEEPVSFETRLLGVGKSLDYIKCVWGVRYRTPATRPTQPLAGRD